jgi:GNAT superfamily N-acetyltransferase
MPSRVEAVSVAELSALRDLTFPAVWRVVSERYASAARALVARTDGEAAGLALAIPGPDGQFELLSVYVLPLLRRLGHGGALLQAMERDFRADGFRLGVHFFTFDDEDKGPALFLRAMGWSRPVVNRLLCRSTVGQAFQTPWLVEATLPERYRIVDWSSLHPSQLAPLEAAVGRWIHADVDPFLAEPDCDEDTSVALVEADTGTVRGWVITHRLDDTTLRWTCSFLEPGLQGTALMRALWFEVVRRQSRRPSLVDFTFTVPVTELRMARFALRRMRPWLSGLAYSCTCVKRLN